MFVFTYLDLRYKDNIILRILLWLEGGFFFIYLLMPHCHSERSEESQE